MCRCKNRIIFRTILPTANNAVDVDRIDLDQPCLTTCLMCRNQGRPTAAEAIEHDGGAVRDVLDGVRDQGNRFDGRVQYELLVALDPESVHPTVLPNVCPISPMLAELKTIDVRRAAGLERKDQLMAGRVEGAHPPLILYPPHNSLHLLCGAR